MITKLQAYAAQLLCGLCILLVSCLGSYLYGRTEGKLLERGQWEQREAQRAGNVATTAIAHTGTVVNEVQTNNDIERKANEALATAQTELRLARADNRRLIAAHGGLRIAAQACAGRSDLAIGTEAASSGRPGDTPTATIALPQPVEQDLLDSADEADDYLEILRTVQQWAVDHGFLGPVKPYRKEDDPPVR